MISITRKGPFKITRPGNLRASELIARGRYDFAHPDIRDEEFNIPEHAPEERAIEIIQFHHGMTLEMVWQAFNQLGLDRPTIEDALQFGIEHDAIWERFGIIFPHEPVTLLNGAGPDVLALHAEPRRRLSLYYVGKKEGENPQHEFAFDSIFGGIRNESGGEKNNITEVDVPNALENYEGMLFTNSCMSGTQGGNYIRDIKD